MIDQVRNTVLSIMNKNNYGYLSPSDFNLYAKQAQLDIFKNYITKYAQEVTKSNARNSEVATSRYDAKISGEGYANLIEKAALDLDMFMVSRDLPFISGSEFRLPSIAYTSDELFKIEKVLCYKSVTTGVAPNQVTVKTFKGIAERIPDYRIDMLMASSLTAPSVLYPVYTTTGGKIKIYPETFNAATDVNMTYLRMPKAPKWTYVTVGASGTALFDGTAPDYQDFELGPDEESELIFKILKFAGISIREADVFNFGKAEETVTNQQQ